MTSPILQKQPIAGYDIKERIGAGGYGEVWRAEAPGGLVKAIKFIYGFLDEVRAAGELKALQRIKQVRHPFLLSLERIEIIESQLVIVTELADGCLKDRYTECRKAGLPGIPREELLVYVGDAADALDYMNAQFSLQHLDVKPENLLLVGGRVKVGDFGLVKDIHDYTVSLMGGLTPIYAPPEVFDGKPSHFSDQYSLAIVYQELLTGVLPFPGKSAAQLAAQHLHGQPRLNCLPERDQGIIHRALAKTPADRFPTCRAMVDELLEAGRAKRAVPTQASASVAESGEAKTAGPAQAQPPQPPRATGNNATERLASPAHPLPAETGTHVQPVVPKARPEAVIVDLPPVACPQDLHLRPTLLVGIGGLAASTLRALRRRLHERFGSLDAVPAIGMLLIDTNRTALCQATQGNEAWVFQPRETLAVPLRRTQDYRRDSDKFLKWLSRRWLYNIPRSQETEGLRPLGRLALVDHLEEVRQRLTAALRQITDVQSAKAAREATGIDFDAMSPRVIFVASIGGGTGSGMVLDAAYVARSLQRELGFSSAEVTGLLLHGTPCQAVARELASVNAYACLAELYHYGQPTHGYPGDPACRLPATSLSPFEHAYLIHLGDDLGDEHFVQGADAVAAYLYRDLATCAGPLLAKCRVPVHREGEAAELRLRTVAMCQVGAGDAMTDRAVELLSRGVVERWSGEASDQPALLVKGPAVGNARPRRPFKLEASDVARLSLDCANTLDLEFSRLRKHVDGLIEGAMGKSPVSHLGPVVQQFLAQQQAVHGEGDSLAVDQFVETLDRLLGPRSEAAQLPSPTAPLEKALVKQIEALAASRGTALADWLYQTCNLPSAGVQGAQQAAEWFVQHVRGLEKEAREAAMALRQEILCYEQVLHGSPLSESRATLLGLGRSKRAPDRAEVLLQMALRRVAELSLRCVIRLLQSLLQRVSVVLDSLRELRRAFSAVSSGFAPTPPLDADEAVSGLPAVQLAVGQALQARLDELTEHLLGSLSRDLLGERGVRSLIEQPELMGQLPRQLRQAARCCVRQALSQVDLAGWLLDDVEGRLKAGLTKAQPQLLAECGGDRRLFIFQPAAADNQRLPQTMRDKLQRDPMVVVGDDPDLLICCEGEHISLPRAAANLTEEWVELPQMAARVRTRVDIPWAGLPD